MKKITLVLAAFTAIIFSFTLQSCNAIKNVIPAQTISLTGASADIVIPVTTDTTAQVTIGQDTISYNLDSLIKAETSNTLSESNIQSVTITSITFTLSDADDSNSFANFSSVNASFNNIGAGNPNLSPYVITNITNNPDTYSDSLALPLATPNQDIKQYFTPNIIFVYTVSAKLRRATTHVLHCHASIAYSITVKA